MKRPMGEAVGEGRRRSGGLYSGLLAAFLLGWAPILGKFAYRAGVTPLTLAALRSLVAALFLYLIYSVAWRGHLHLRAQELLSCLLVGAVNGIGSIFYYAALERLDASQASLLSTLYVVWVVIFLSASGEPVTRLTVVRLVAALVGALLVTAPWGVGGSDYLGAMLMAASAAVNGWYFVMGQWVLADVPARPATLYILTGMAVTVSVARLLGPASIEPIAAGGWVAIGALGCTTALSRLAMFFSLERLGGVQTAIISLLEMVVSLGLALFLLGDRLNGWQWVGAILLVGGNFLARRDLQRGALPPVAFDPTER